MVKGSGGISLNPLNLAITQNYVKRSLEHAIKDQDRGPFGLVQQLAAVEYARPRKFRENLQQCLKTVQLVAPECPAEIMADGENLRIHPVKSIHSSALA